VGFNCVFLENLGVVVGGADLGEAFQRFETLEFTAKTVIKAGVLCGVGGAVAAGAGKDAPGRVGVGARKSAETAGETPAVRGETPAVRGVRYLSDAQIALAEKGRGEMPSFVAGEATTLEKSLRQQLCDFIRRGYRQRLFTSTEGSFSARLSADSFLITCYRVDRKTIALDQLALIRGGRAEAGSRPSRAVRIHEAIYRRHAGVQAVVNAMPVNATAFSVTGMALDARTIPESYIFLRDIGVVPFEEQFGNGEAIAEMVSMKKPAMFMENNGVLVLGTSVLDAFDRLEVFESTAEAIINARPIGEVMPMERGHIGELMRAFGME
jgi:L-fuculose-phosphate aldolase